MITYYFDTSDGRKAWCYADYATKEEAIKYAIKYGYDICYIENPEKKMKVIWEKGKVQND